MFPLGIEKDQNLKEEFINNITNNENLDLSIELKQEQKPLILLKLFSGCIDAYKFTRPTYMTQEKSAEKSYTEKERENGSLYCTNISKIDKVYELGVNCAPILESVIRKKDHIFLDGVIKSHPIWTFIKNKDKTKIIKDDLSF